MPAARESRGFHTPGFPPRAPTTMSAHTQSSLRTKSGSERASDSAEMLRAGAGYKNEPSPRSPGMRGLDGVEKCLTMPMLWQ